MAAREAGSQMHPLVAERDALRADMHLGRDVMAVGKMFAVRHGSPEMVASPDAIKCDAGEKGAAPAMGPVLLSSRADN